MWDNWVDAVVSTWTRHPRSEDDFAYGRQSRVEH